jgi:serine/threonine protein kinase
MIGMKIFFRSNDCMFVHVNWMSCFAISSLICYELPSKQTLDGFLQTSNQEISEEIVYYILNDLVQAIDYLTSKQIAHRAIVPENIILIESSQVNDNKVIRTIRGTHSNFEKCQLKYWNSHRKLWRRIVWVAERYIIQFFMQSYKNFCFYFSSE